MDSLPPPPRSSARPLRLLGRGRPDPHLGPAFGRDLRRYEGDARVERVWQRLESRRLGGAGHTRWAMALVAGVSLGLGFWSGRSSVDVSGSLGAQAETSFAARGLPSTDSARSEPPVRSSGSEAAAAAAAEPAHPREVLVAAARRGRHPSVSRPDAAPLVVLTPLVEAPLPLALPSDQVRPGASWVELAELGDYARAFQTLDESGELPALVAQGTPEELMTLADVARFAGRNGWAIQALREVTTRHEADENAPLAAMMLGNLLSRAGDAEGAARAYALNRRLSPEGDFAEDALVREFGVAVKAGERVRAEGLLGEYSRKFPASVRLSEMQQSFADLAASEEPAVEDAEPEPADVDPVDPDPN